MHFADFDYFQRLFSPHQQPNTAKHTRPPHTHALLMHFVGGALFFTAGHARSKCFTPNPKIYYFLLHFATFRYVDYFFLRTNSQTRPSALNHSVYRACWCNSLPASSVGSWPCSLETLYTKPEDLLLFATFCYFLLLLSSHQQSKVLKHTQTQPI